MSLGRTTRTPRRSVTLAVQRFFRPLRPHPGKKDVRIHNYLPDFSPEMTPAERRAVLLNRFSNPDEHVSDPQQTISPDTGSVDGNGVNIAAKLQQGKKAMAERCQRVGKAILGEAGVKDVHLVPRPGSSGPIPS